MNKLVVSSEKTESINAIEDLNVEDWYSELIDENFTRTEQSIGPKCHGPYGGDEKRCLIEDN